MKLYFKLSFLILLFICQAEVLPQISSSYSRLGVGDMVYTYSARRAGMGELGASVVDAEYISFLNPASLTGLETTRTELGMMYNGLFLSNNNASSYSANTDFTGVTLALPISIVHGITLAAGLLPYSKVSYREENQYIGNGSVTNAYNIDYVGSGGLSKMILASSYRFPFDLSLGATVEYYFGDLNYTSSISFPNDNSIRSGTFTTRYRPRGFSSSVGIISPDISNLFNLESVSNFRLGIALSFGTTLLADTSILISASSVEDTLQNSSVDMNLPYRIAGGLSFVLNKNYLFSLDYLYQPWSKYALNGVTSSYMRDSYKISTGFEYRPGKQLGQSFWEQVMLRLGLTYEQTQYNINGQGINKYSVMGGISLPLGYKNTLDIGLEYTIRGTRDFNLFQEKIIKLSAGISVGELWFIRSDNY
jgi:hypothetical protein